MRSLLDKARHLIALEIGEWDPSRQWESFRWWELNLASMQALLSDDPSCILTKDALLLIFDLNNIRAAGNHVAHAFSLEEIHDAIVHMGFKYAHDKYTLQLILSCLHEGTIYPPAIQHLLDMAHHITASEMARWHPAEEWQPCQWWELDLQTMEDLLKKNPFCNLTDAALGLIFHSNYVREPNTHVFCSFSLEEIHDTIMNLDFQYCEDILCILSCVCKHTIFHPTWQDFCHHAAASTMVRAGASQHFPTW